MAYVRKTDTLVDAIDRKVSAMRDAAQKPHAQEELSVGSLAYDALREHALASMWSKAPSLRSQMPADWCVSPSRIDVHIYDEYGGKRLRLAHVENYDADPILVPPKNSSYAPDCKVKYDDLPPLAQAWMDDNTQRAAKCEEIWAQFGVVRQQLAAFMRQHSSLNSALKEMPEIELYVPDDYMNRYRAKAAPRTKAEAPTNVEELNIDRDSLAAAAIAHRMSQSNAA